jgi:hypothetical protein
MDIFTASLSSRLSHECEPATGIAELLLGNRAGSIFRLDPATWMANNAFIFDPYVVDNHLYLNRPAYLLRSLLMITDRRRQLAGCDVYLASLLFR